jgi:GDSL/SGNH-like Acyl-Esterase family found in Pmr5 and Cas1p
MYQHTILHGHMSHKKLDIIGLFKSWSLKPSDLVVANFGHNFHQDVNVYRNFLRKLSDDYEYAVLKMRESMPTLLWMETSPQHFPNSTKDNGYFDDKLSAKYTTCSAYENPVGYHNNDLRNRVAEEVMHAASIPILRIADSAVSQFDVHLGEADLRGHRHMDCTHFCSNAGIFKHWSNLLYNVIPILLTKQNQTLPQATPALPLPSESGKKKYIVPEEKLHLFVNISRKFTEQNAINFVKHKDIVPKGSLSGIYLTTGKDAAVFIESMKSALTHLVDVHIFFVICPHANELKEKFSSVFGKRVIFFDEADFPVSFNDVADVMLETVREVGSYPLNDGKSVRKNP